MLSNRRGSNRSSIEDRGDEVRAQGRQGAPVKKPDELRRENEALRERITRLSAAILRISASLDLNTVLQEVIESACALTGARYGGITTLDQEGQVQDFLTSGITPDEHRKLAAWPEGKQLLEGFQRLPAPLRVRDLPAYVRSLGISSTLLSDLIPTKTLQGTPMRHRGAHVGNFFLGDKKGGQEFTSEDEEVLVLFAAQAATAIANARTHQDERRARADLEALIETSPVGVAVFDARTGAPVSFNREARRIVEGLRTPGRPPEELLSVATCHRADGREISLAELPLVQQFNDSPETVRAEEMVLSVPDGRNVKMLVNATPLRSAGGAVESVIVTLQDLAPLEELERMRTEFLAMVSHELRAPLTSIKGSTATVLGASSPLHPAEMRQFFRIVDEQADLMRGLISDLLDAGRIETGTLSVTPEPVAVAGLVDQARNTFLSGGGRHAVRIDLPLDLPRVLADRERIVQVLNNLFSNAARHAPASTPIRVVAAQDGVQVAVSVSDEGRGVPPEQLPHLFRKHAGLAGEDRERGGGRYGLGLAICKGLVEAHGGRIRAESAGAGYGTRVTFTIPVVDEAHGAATAVASNPRPLASPHRADAHPRGRRRPADAALRAGRARRGRLRPARDGRPAGAGRPPPDTPPPAGAAGSDAAGRRWHRVAGAHPGAGRPAGHLHLRLRPGRDDREGVGARSRRLHRQALLADGANGESAGGPAPAGRAGTFRAARPGDPLRAAPGAGGGPSGAVDGHGVRLAPRALGQCGTGADQRGPPPAGVGRAGRGRREAAAHLREEAPAEAGR